MNVDRMKSVLRIVLGLFALVLMILWSGGCFRKQLPAGDRVGAQAGVVVPEGAETVVVSTGTLSPMVDIAGTVESEEKINLSSRISAYIKEVFVSAGDQVTAGQTLITLDDRELNERLAMVKAELNRAEIEYNRMKQLIATKVVTDQQLIAAQTAYNLAKSDVERVQVNLSDTRIISPINGLVTDRRVEVGDLAIAGEVLLSVYDPDRLRIRVPVPVRLADRVREGSEIQVSLDAYGDAQGVVTEVVGEIDEQSRTQDVNIELTGLNKRIFPGTFGRVWVITDERPGILIPQTAIYENGQLKLVQLVVNGRVIRRLITTGAAYDGQLEVLSGLQDGDEVLLQPVH